MPHARLQLVTPENARSLRKAQPVRPRAQNHDRIAQIGATAGYALDAIERLERAIFSGDLEAARSFVGRARVEARYVQVLAEMAN